MGQAQSGRSWVKVDGQKDFKWTVFENERSGKSTLDEWKGQNFHFEIPFLVEWPSTLNQDHSL